MLPLHSQFPHTSALAKLSFFSESLPSPFSPELARCCPFKIKPSENPEAKLLVSYPPWIKAELRAILKDFPKVTEDPHGFVEEFNIIIHIYQPGFSDLYQLVHMVVGEGQSQHSMKTTNWENPERSPEIKPGDQPADLLYEKVGAIARQLY